MFILRYKLFVKKQEEVKKVGRLDDERKRKLDDELVDIYVHAPSSVLGEVADYIRSNTGWSGGKQDLRVGQDLLDRATQRRFGIGPQGRTTPER